MTDGVGGRSRDLLIADDDSAHGRNDRGIGWLAGECVGERSTRCEEDHYRAASWLDGKRVSDTARKVFPTGGYIRVRGDLARPQSIPPVAWCAGRVYVGPSGVIAGHHMPESRCRRSHGLFDHNKDRHAVGPYVSRADGGIRKSGGHDHGFRGCQVAGGFSGVPRRSRYMMVVAITAIGIVSAYSRLLTALAYPT
jgi:hypothetical protein